MRFFSRARRDALALEDDDGPPPRYEFALPVVLMVSERGNSGTAVSSPEREGGVGTDTEGGGVVYADVGTVRAV